MHAPIVGDGSLEGGGNPALESPGRLRSTSSFVLGASSFIHDCSEPRSFALHASHELGDKVTLRQLGPGLRLGVGDQNIDNASHCRGELATLLIKLTTARVGAVHSARSVGGILSNFLRVIGADIVDDDLGARVSFNLNGIRLARGGNLARSRGGQLRREHS